MQLLCKNSKIKSESHRVMTNTRKRDFIEINLQHVKVLKCYADTEDTSQKNSKGQNII